MVELKNNVTIGCIIIAVQIMFLAVLDYFAAKRSRRVGEAIVMDLKRLGLNPSSLTALTEIPQFCSPKFPTPGRFRT